MKRLTVLLLLALSAGALAMYIGGGQPQISGWEAAKPKPAPEPFRSRKGPASAIANAATGEVAFDLEDVAQIWPGYFPNSNEPDAFSGVEIGDVTGDGRKDLIYTSGIGVHIVPQTAQGTFAPEITFYLFSPPRPYGYDFMVGSTLADMNRDGILDIVITRAFSLVFLLSDGAGGFRIQTHANSELIASASAVILDLDGDGLQDAITPVFLGHAQMAADPESRLVVSYGDGYGGIARFGRLPIADRYVHKVVVGDLNQDGRPDLATLESESFFNTYTTLVVRYNNGVGAFGAAMPLSQAVSNALAIGDFNGDGRNDVAASGTPFDFGTFLNPTIKIFQQDAFGNLAATPISKLDLAYSSAMVAPDLDGDGRADLLTVQDGQGSLAYFLQRNGRMTDRRYYDAFPGGPSSRFGPDAVAIGDLNGDGAEDIAVAGGYVGVKIIAGKRVPYTGSGLVPGIPVIGTATKQAQSTQAAIVTFLPPAANGGEPITGYTVQAIPDGPRDRQGGLGGNSHVVEGLENDKTYRFVVRAHNAAGESAPSAMSNTVIYRNLPLMSISDDIVVLEGDAGTTTARFEINTQPALSTGIEFDVIMEPTAAGTTATVGEDYILRSPTHIIIPPGGRSATFDVQIVGDTVREASFEEFYIKLANVTGAEPLPINRARCRIVDNDKDPTAMLPLAETSIIEGNVGTTQAVVTFQLASPLPNDVTFDASTRDGTAIAGSDYLPRQATGLRIPAGQTSVDFAIDIIGDTLSEGDEYFAVLSSNVVGAGSGASGYVTITSDDDAIPTVSIDDEMVTEGDDSTATMVFTARLSSPAPFNGAYVEFVVDDAAGIGAPALANVDYSVQPVTGVIIPRGATTAKLSVKIRGDKIPEADELFRVRLLSIARAIPGRVEAYGLIIDNDRTPSALTTTKKSALRPQNGVPTRGASSCPAASRPCKRLLNSG